MRYMTTQQPITEWHNTQGVRMRIIAEYNPNEESDPWVEFENIVTQQRYSCRKAAFLARYTPKTN
jgi:hypothetical protein